MSYLPKEKYGKKLLYHHSGGAIASVILSFLVIGLVAATFFLPYQGFISYMNTPEAVTGMSFVMLVVKAITNEPEPALAAFNTSLVNNVFDGNGIATLSINIYYYFMVFFLVMMVIYAFILFIGSLVLLFKGSLKHWKLPASMAGKIFVVSIFFHGPICLINLYNGVIKKLVMPTNTNPALGSTWPCFFTYIIFGGIFILQIILSVIYNKCFRNHVYVKNEETLNQYIEEFEKDKAGVDLTDTDEGESGPIDPKEEEVAAPTIEAPKKKEEFEKQNILIELPKPVEEKTEAPKDDTNEARKHLPKGLKVIGGHAFSQNTMLEDADIPEGIDVLGSGAFANCVNLRRIHLPLSLKKIEYNCFFNCIRLEKITYAGTRENWRKIKRGSNWLTSSGTNIVNCIDGAIAVDRTK